MLESCLYTTGAQLLLLYCVVATHFPAHRLCVPSHHLQPAREKHMLNLKAAGLPPPAA